MQFSLPGMEAPITADGVVVHKLSVGRSENPSVGGMGIKFSELDDASRLLLEEYIQKSGISGSKSKN